MNDFNVFAGEWHCYLSNGNYNGTANVNVDNGHVMFTIPNNSQIPSTLSYETVVGHPVVHQTAFGVNTIGLYQADHEGGRIAFNNSVFWTREKRP